MNSSILIVEDNEDDLGLFTVALRKFPLTEAESFHIERDGKSALDYLRVRLENGTSLPVLLIVDLKMPVLDGHELLETVRMHPKLNNIPVVMFTASNFPRDRQKAAALGVTLYLVKPSRFEEMREVIQTLDALIRSEKAKRTA